MAGPRRERKVVTVLFADLVGFTARAESLDPEDVDAFLRPYHERLREELERWGGTVEKFIGDAVVAVFGAPVSREDDPERAVRAALAIRDWAAEEDGVEVRIAVNTGEALVSLDARPDAGEGIVTGDVVNTASRLQSAAPVNGVLVGEGTHRGTSHVIDYGEAEPVVAKGKTEPVPVWEALHARSRFGVDVRQHGGAPLVGRERELDVLTSALERVRDEREPQLVTLVGVPGIGKSRLAWELFEWIGRGDELTYWRQGRSLPYGEGVSLWALAEMVKAHAGILEGDGADVVAAKLDAAVVEAGVDDADWVAARLRPLVGLGADAEVARDESFTAWRTFFESLGDRHPLVLVFEDVHWADDVLLDFVEHLVDWASGVPILVLCSARPELYERRPGWGGGKLNATTVALSPLTDDDSARLLGLILDQALLPAETQRALLERASGNPLYAEQFARLYRERGTVEGLPLPDSVQGLIAARLDALPPEEKSLLQDAAVFGKVFWSGALGDGDGVVDRLHSLERKEFVRRERRSSVADEQEYVFRHGLVRDVAYGQIPRGDRAAKHVRAAGWIDALGRPQDHAELLAGHYLAVLELDRDGSLADEIRVRAVRALGDAADRAAALNSFANAAAYAQAALDLAPADAPERPQLLFELGRAKSRALSAGREELLEAAAAFEAADDPERAAECRVLVALGGYEVGREADIEEQLALAAALVESRPPSRSKGAVASARARAAYLAGRHAEARAHGEEALALADGLDEPELRSEALLYLGGAKAELGDASGIDDVRASVEIAEAANSGPMIARSRNNLSILLRLDGRVEEALAAAEGALAAAERFGMRGVVEFGRGAKPFRLYERGRWDEALRLAEDVLGALDPGEHRGNEVSARSAVAAIALARDDAERALAESAAAVEAASASVAALPKYPALGFRAYVLASLGRLDEAREVERVLAEYHRAKAAPTSFGGDSRSPWTWEQVGMLDEMLQVFAIGRETPWLAAARAVAAEGWTRAARLYEALGPPSSAAFARLQSGTDADVRAALDFFRSAGAPFYVRQAEAKLAAIA